MSGFIGRRWALLVAAVAVICWLGCGDGGEDESNPGDVPANGGLVCTDGEAWVKCEVRDGVEFCIGYIFKSNSELIFIEREANVWYKYTDGGYNWRIDGDTLIIYDDENAGIVTYSLTDNALTLTFEGQPQTYTKRSGVYPRLTKSRANTDMSKFLLNLKK
ncbi:MAG: hypothetical protein LBB74_01880 [Chitinispirillales bacterium]|jgi:hypothetical protein|nr:hypothetical protein [Chitinispirillales bacterium]